MKKLNHFINSLNVLKKADFSLAENDEIYRTGVIGQFRLGFIDDSAVWLLMLKNRNAAIHIYDEDKADEMILLIRDSFIPSFQALADTLKKKQAEAEGDWDESPFL